ncbi:TrbI/VirB10 family protein [Geomonas paludis]|uniref:Conjugal transfer protein TraI n=1 Tax=Geomonas paludis TaxID=2740185 RepID=A0A6V8MTV4_9BACT|nr:TrbI/VirB10 family protein [Geomonas paludis]GFO63605.1 conjugal transfer protein TraI [Geomonas paludis]
MAAKETQGEESTPGPLEKITVKVVRFNRKALTVLTVVFTASITFALVAGLSPKKTATGEERKPVKEEEVKSQTAPGLPDPMISAPGNYQELGRKQASRPAAGQSGKAGRDPGPDAVAEPAPTQQPTSAYTVTLPGQTAESHAHKDGLTAISSPVTFSQGEPPQQGRGEEPRPLVVPTLPGLPQLGERPVPDDQNMQGEKRDFSRERQQDLPYLKTTLMAPISQYEIKAGTILPATLITGINSDLPGQIIAQLRENVFDTVTGNYLLVPQGTRLIGEYDSKVAFGQERVLVVWTRLIMPNGESINLEGMPGADLSGYAGMGGRVNNHYGKLVTGVVLGSVIGAGAQVAVGGQGAPNVPPTFGNLAVSGAAQNINQAAQQHTNKVLNMQPSIEVSPGDKINVFVTKDMILKPFME